MIGGDIAFDFESNSVSHCYESTSLRESGGGALSGHAELAVADAAAVAAAAVAVAAPMAGDNKCPSHCCIGRGSEWRRS